MGKVRHQVSDRQVAVNQSNAQKSTGPKTLENLNKATAPDAETGCNEALKAAEGRGGVNKAIM
jgi:hypothetical protein